MWLCKVVMWSCTRSCDNSAWHGTDYFGAEHRCSIVSELILVEYDLIKKVDPLLCLQFSVVYPFRGFSNLYNTKDVNNLLCNNSNSNYGLIYLPLGSPAPWGSCSHVVGCERPIKWLDHLLCLRHTLSTAKRKKNHNYSINRIILVTHRKMLLYVLPRSHCTG